MVDLLARSEAWIIRVISFGTMSLNKATLLMTIEDVHILTICLYNIMGYVYIIS